MDSPLHITFFKPRLSHFVETMAVFAATEKQLTVRIVTFLDRGSEDTEHPWILDRLRKHPRIQLTDLAEPPAASSLVIFGLVRHAPFERSLSGWLKLTRASAIYPEANYYGSRFDWLREMARGFSHLLRARFAIFERAPQPLDFRFGCRRRLYFPPSVHPQYLADPDLRNAMLAPVPAGPRRFRVAFVGNRQPPERGVRLDSVLHTVKSVAGISLTTRFPSERASDAEALWIEYGGVAGSVGLKAGEYTTALGESEFCLSPPGWGGNWTHRTIEACMRAAIPVIEDPDRYAIPFVDGENCILVANADWAGAVRRCLDSSPAEIARMRERVLRLREERLLPEVAARNFCRNLLAQM